MSEGYVQSDSPIVKILAEAKLIGQKTGVDGLISADRVFGLLEREFLPYDINLAVASALRPQIGCDVNAHAILRRLATTREGLTRIVTTNFDRIFDECGSNLKSFQPPNLPNPSRPKDFDGIVYLHGKAGPNYDCAEGDGFILSSSDFGRAYLADGWATRFFREILEKYFVVFVGYSADDPPIHYLLEALNKTLGKLNGVYAFQSGDAGDATARWQYKGVEAIPYSSERKHAALWETLEAWADRADDPDQWTTRVLDTAGRGPNMLAPHQRGQVAHIVGTLEGMRKFSEAATPPPAEWLCVFDPGIRYERPGRVGRYGEPQEFVDPFDFFGIDIDKVPDRHDPDDLYAKREVPLGAWDAFELNTLDRLELRDENVSSARGQRAQTVPNLPRRISELGNWIAIVAHQPTTVWWAAAQNSLHPEIAKHIERQVEQKNVAFTDAVAKSWRVLFEYWQHRHDEHDGWYDLQRRIANDGWNTSVVREFAHHSRPYLTAERSSWTGIMPPDTATETQVHDIIQPDVSYPDLPPGIEVPNKWLKQVSLEVRRNLELSSDLELEIGGFGLTNLSPINPETETEVDRYGRTRGLSSWMLYFVGIFKRLLDFDQTAAISEFSQWPKGDKGIFTRLRVWAYSDARLLPANGFADAIEGLSDEEFWASGDARDLLLTIKCRWPELDFGTRRSIEQRVIAGSARWEEEEEEEAKFVGRRAWYALNRISWMKENGLSLTCDLSLIVSELRPLAPDWEPEYASGAAKSLEGRSGWVQTETDYSQLSDAPLDKLLAKCSELSGRHDTDFVRRDPYAGLSKDAPIRAFAALRKAVKSGNFPEWAWRTFLSSEQRKKDKPRLTLLIAAQLVALAPEQIEIFIRAATDWCEKSSKLLSSKYPDMFSALVARLLDVLEAVPADSGSAILRQKKEPDWTMEAINSPTGDLAEAIWQQYTSYDLTAGQGIPTDLRARSERILSLPGDLRRHALVIFSYQATWFFWVDPQWTKNNLLAALSPASIEDLDAFWAGFLWAARVPQPELFRILKPHMLDLAKSGRLEKRGHAEALSGMILNAWALIDDKSGERWISDNELRDLLLASADDLRKRILWQASHWTSQYYAPIDPAEEDAQRDRIDWPSLVIILIRDVWPRQITARSADVSARMVDLVFDNEELMVELAPIVARLVTKFEARYLALPSLRKSSSSVVEKYPSLVLSLLFAILPDDANRWPYGMDSTLKQLTDIDPALSNDEQMIELRRRWNSR